MLGSQLAAQAREHLADILKAHDFPRRELDRTCLFDGHDERDVGQRVPAGHILGLHGIRDDEVLVIEDFPKDALNRVLKIIHDSSLRKACATEWTWARWCSRGVAA